MSTPELERLRVQCHRRRLYQIDKNLPRAWSRWRKRPMPSLEFLCLEDR
jgi:hypothetical protein